eukprot:gene38572-50661_t
MTQGCGSRLQLHGINKHFGPVHANKDIHLQIKRGTVHGIVGENGAGKSTLLKCLTGVLELNAGQVIRSRGLRIGQVPQDVPDGLAALPVRDVLGQSLAKVGQDGEDWRIDVLLDEIGVDPEMLDKPFGALSGGWQRLMLIAAAARLEEPDILILDEPTNHLDLANINTLERWLTADFTVPMLMVSHDREFLDRATERTLFLRADGVHTFKTRFSVAREELLRRDATSLGPAGTMGPVDLVFLDPPYGKGLAEQALTSLKAGGWLHPETLLVLEESSDVTVELPDGFTLDDRREYGAAAVHFLTLS